MHDADQQDLTLLLSAAHEAGKIAAKHFRASYKTWDKGDGQGPVTEADLAVNAFLHAELTAARPDYGWLSEESDPLGDLSRTEPQSTFVIDPIDGTRAFIDGQTGFATSVAVLRNGKPVAGVVHLPMRDLTYAAVLGGGATLNGGSLTCPAFPDENKTADVLGAKAAFDLARWPGGQPPIKRHFRPSLAWRLALVAEGRFDAMMTLRQAWDWDIAAGALIATEAGISVSDMTGGALVFNTPDARNHGVIVARKGLHERLLEGLNGSGAAPVIPNLRDKVDGGM